MLGVHAEICMLENASAVYCLHPPPVFLESASQRPVLFRILTQPSLFSPGVHACKGGLSRGRAGSRRVPFVLRGLLPGAFGFPDRRLGASGRRLGPAPPLAARSSAQALRKQCSLRCSRLSLFLAAL